MFLPANGIRRVLGIVTYGLGLIGMLGGAAIAIDARYAKADDLKAIRQDIQCYSRDTKLNHLKTRELFLVQEESRLEVQRTKNGLTAIETQRYNELLADHGQLQAERRRLDAQPGCP